MTRWQSLICLPKPSRSGFYSVESGTSRFRVGRSHEDHPALLIEFRGAYGASTPRRLASISYAPPVTVDLVSESGIHRESELAVLECRSNDPDLGGYFFRIADAILIRDESLADEASFENALDATIALFRGLQQPGFRTAQGLWAELAVILWSQDPAAALSSWHSSPHSLHDFSAGSFRLEVKSTRKQLREHAFKLDQLSSLRPGITLIASIMVRESDSGASIFDLVEAIKKRIGTHGSASRLEAIVAASIGSGWRDARELRFLLEEAQESFALYRADQIPSVPQPIPPEVKDVQFTVDLSSTPEIPLQEGRRLSDLYRVLLPNG